MKRSYAQGRGGLSPAVRRRIAAQALMQMSRKPKKKNARSGGFLGMEKKFVDYEYDAALSLTMSGAEADPSALSISAIAQGDGESQRDGRKAVLKDVFVNGIFTITKIAGAELSNGGIVKIVLLLDTQTNGAQFNAEDVFVEPANADLDALTFRNLQYQQRFKVLKVAVITANPTAGAGDGAVNDSPHYTIPFKLSKQGLDIPVNHTGTTAAVASIADNSLHVLAVGSPNTLSPGSIAYYSRVRFVG